MAAKTANDVIKRALRRINYIGDGEEVDADSYSDALAEYKVFHEWLRKEFPTKVGWGFDLVDDRYWTHVAAMLAGRVFVFAFPTSSKARQRAMEGADVAETMLREQFARSPLSRTKAEYF